MAAGEPLVLLHPLGMSARVWEPLRPALEPHHEFIALTTLGHRGGGAAARRPATVGDLVDDAERALNARGLARPHIAGTSLGGWMVCALSPAGSWTAGTTEQTAGARRIRRSILSARLGRPLPMPLLMRSGTVRRLVLRDAAAHGDRLTVEQTVEATRDLLGCVIAEDILTTDEELAALDPPPCPITLAWAAEDRLLRSRSTAPSHGAASRRHASRCSPAPDTSR